MSNESLFCGENLGFVMNTLCAFSVEFEFFQRNWTAMEHRDHTFDCFVTDSVLSPCVRHHVRTIECQFFRCLELNFERNQGQEWTFLHDRLQNRSKTGPRIFR